MPFDTLPSLSFPAQPLDGRVELQIPHGDEGVYPDLYPDLYPGPGASAWTDVTAYCQHDQVVVGRGHPDESTTTAPTTLAMSLFNADGRFSARNPAGPYYGQLRRNTQCRVSLPEGASYLRLEGDSVSYAQGPAVSIAGDLEIQLDVTLDNWNGAQTLACKWNKPVSQRSWLLEMNDAGQLTFWVSPDGVAQTPLASTVSLPSPPLLRQCIRVTYQASTATATFYTAPPGLTGAVWTQAGTAVSAGSAITPFSSPAPVLLGARTDGSGFAGINGKIHAMLLLSGIGGTQKASPDFTAQIPGAATFADAQSNTWTLHGTSEVSNRKYQCHVEVPQWAQNQDPSGHTVYAKVQGGGILRRMAQGQSPAASPLTRAYLRLPSSLQLAGYWSCEDLAGATQLASGIGGIPGTATPQVQLASSSVFAASSPIPVLNGGTMSFIVSAPGVTWTDNVTRFLLAVPSGDDTNGAAAATIYTTGTIARLQLIYGTGGNLTLQGYNSAGAQVFTSGLTGPFAPSLLGGTVRVSVELTSNGGSPRWQFFVISPGGAGQGPSGSFSGSIGAVTQVRLGGGLTGSAMGQVSVQGLSDSINDLSQPLNAWFGEPAGVRFGRICSEEGIQFRGRGQMSTTVPMGNQTSQTVQQLLQECVDADLGIWTETRQVLGFGYRARSAVGNMSPANSLTFNDDHMEIWSSDPVEDDQIVVNDVTVTQTSDSSSSHQVADTGSPIDGGNLAVSKIGRYDQSYPVNVPDSYLDANAGWRLHMGTVDEPRFPGIAIDLANFTLGQEGLILPLLDMDLGDRLVMSGVTGLPWLPPGLAGQIDQVMNGSTLTMWVARVLGQAWQGVPYSPWPVGIIGDPVYGRADTDGSTVSTGIGVGATSMLVATTPGKPLWTTDPAQFPFDIQINSGDVKTVTLITGSSSPQTFTLLPASVNGVQVAHAAGEDVRLAHPMIISPS